VAKGKDNKNWKGGEFVYGWLYNKIYASATKRGHECSVTLPYLEKLFIEQEKKCALSGIPLTFGRSSATTTASLDRIDSDAGYIEGNVQWLHKDINMMKQRINNCLFIEYCKLVAQKLDHNC
jgi:hypothetical protein